MERDIEEETNIAMSSAHVIPIKSTAHECKLSVDDSDDASDELGTGEHYQDWSDPEIESDLSDVFEDSCGEPRLDNALDSLKPIPGVYDEKLGGKIIEWKAKNKIPDAHVNSILTVFQPYVQGLPKKCSDLSSIKENYEVSAMAPGEFVYFGIKRYLIKRFTSNLQKPVGVGSKYDEFLNEANRQGCRLLTLTLNIDGIPLFKSSSKQFWAISCCVHEYLDSSPFLVGLYCGNRKPDSAEDFLRCLIDEVKSLTNHILEIEGHAFCVKLYAFVCDTPARCFIKGTKSFQAYHGCEYCIQKGKRLHTARKTIFPEINVVNRRDGDEKSARFREYFRLKTGLGDICGLISQIPPDPMHLCYLGVMRHLLYTWIKSTRNENYRGRVSASCLRELEDRIQQLQHDVPKEFRRRLRKLSEFERMKAKEFRLLLLYIGPVLFRSLTQTQYSHFLQLHFAIYVLSSEKWFAKLGQHAHACLKKFVAESSKVYSLSFLTYNLHLLQHLQPFTESLGVLSFFSAFSFENFFRQVKGIINSPYKPLQQVSKRLSYLSGKTAPYQLHFSSRYPDNCAITDEGVISIVNVCQDSNDQTLISGHRLLPFKNLYENPYNSLILGIGYYKKSQEYVSNVNARNKAFVLQTENDKEYVVIPYTSATYFS